MKIYLTLLVIFAAQASMATTRQAEIVVSLTITSSSTTSTQLSQNAQDYQSAKALHILTDAADGANVDVYLNTAKIATVPSQNGMVQVRIDDAFQNADNMRLSFRSGNRVVQVLESSVEKVGNFVPKMSIVQSSQIVDLTSNKVESKIILLEY